MAGSCRFRRAGRIAAASTFVLAVVAACAYPTAGVAEAAAPSPCEVAQQLIDKGYLNAATTALGSSTDSCVPGLKQVVSTKMDQSKAARQDGDEYARVGDLANARASYDTAHELWVEAPAEDRTSSAGETAIFRSEQGQGLLDQLASVVIGSLVLFCLGRLFSYGTRREVKGISSRAARVCAGLGVVLSVAAAVLLTLALWPGNWWLLAAIGGAGAIVGIRLTARAAGRRLGARLEVTNSDGTWNDVVTQYLYTTVSSLGSDAPQGLEQPRRLDTTSLPEDALTTVPQGKVIAALFKVARQVVPASPWSVQVALVSETRISVAIYRNNRQIDSQNISTRALGLETLAPEREKILISTVRAELMDAAAAFIIVTLADKHAELHPGLCGADKWEALALYLVGADASAMNAPKAGTLLTRAVSMNPDAQLARVAEFVYYGKRETSPAAQREVAEALHTEGRSMLVAPADPTSIVKPGFAALHLRTLYAETGLWLNLHAEDESLVDPCCGYCSARALMRRCVDYTVKPPDPKLAAFVDGMKVAAAYRWLSVQKLGWAGCEDQDKHLLERADEWTQRVVGARDRYEKACYLLIKPKKKDRGRALVELRSALHDPAIRAWAKRDPSLKPLRSDPVFQKLLGVTRESWSSIPGCTNRNCRHQSKNAPVSSTG